MGSESGVACERQAWKSWLPQFFYFVALILNYCQTALGSPIEARQAVSQDGVTSGATTLASDIAPLVQLIGAAPLRQFLAYSMGNKRGILSLFGSIGVVRAMSIYIRVYSCAWLRYIIGRAGEGSEEVLTEVYRLPKEGNGVFWTPKGGFLTAHEGRAMMIVMMTPVKGKHRSLTKVMTGLDFKESKKKAKTIPLGYESVIHQVEEAWPQVTSSTISRSRMVAIDDMKILVCCTTGMGAGTLRSMKRRRRILVAFSIFCILGTTAQGGLIFLMWRARVAMWLIVSCHILYYAALGWVLWRLLSVDKRRSLQNQVKNYDYEIQSLKLLQPAVNSGDATMPELITFPPDTDFSIYPPELDDAFAGLLGKGQVLQSISNNTTLGEASDSLLLITLVLGYLMYFTALASMKTISVLLSVGALGSSLVAKGLVNTIEASRVTPSSITVAAGRCDIATVLLASVPHRASSAKLTSMFINLVLQLNLTYQEVEPVMKVSDNEWISFVPVAKGHRLHSSQALIAFPTVQGTLPLGLLIRLWLISGDLTHNVEIPERIEPLDWTSEQSKHIAARPFGAGPEDKDVLNDWTTFGSQPGDSDADDLITASSSSSQHHHPHHRIHHLYFCINGNWYHGRLQISRDRPTNYVDLASVDHLAPQVSDAVTSRDYALLEQDWCVATGCRGWDSGNRYKTMTTRMANTLAAVYDTNLFVKPQDSGSDSDSSPRMWEYAGDERPGTRGSDR
ncbi:MAG: hypothetical protein M1823_002481 [Watsoniomyces obsoletus]|nr:MAG: hypothetical protein M1823_002481 [Watsoniomyces obsoletus]